jgi:endonuclease YncB( thermonuclease family)
MGNCIHTRRCKTDEKRREQEREQDEEESGEIEFNTARPPTPPKRDMSFTSIRSEEDVKLDFDFDSVDNSKLWIKTKPFVPPVVGGRVIKVYDGDTITIASTIPIKKSPLYRFSVRLNGIDTPEIKGSDEIEKRVALIARDALSEKILYKDVELINVQTEKYGRLLAEVVFNGENMNEWMITQRFAVKYDGGTKKSPDNWETYHKGN